nr:MAG TPA: hypothetical protein [Caudoviricetes sp.]
MYVFRAFPVHFKSQVVRKLVLSQHQQRRK